MGVISDYLVCLSPRKDLFKQVTIVPTRTTFGFVDLTVDGEAIIAKATQCVLHYFALKVVGPYCLGINLG